MVESVVKGSEIFFSDLSPQSVAISRAHVCHPLTYWSRLQNSADLPVDVWTSLSYSGSTCQNELQGEFGV